MENKYSAQIFYMAVFLHIYSVDVVLSIYSPSVVGSDVTHVPPVDRNQMRCD